MTNFEWILKHRMYLVKGEVARKIKVNTNGFVTGCIPRSPVCKDCIFLSKSNDCLTERMDWLDQEHDFSREHIEMLERMMEPEFGEPELTPAAVEALRWAVEKLKEIC